MKVIALILSYKNVESKKTSFDRETKEELIDDFIEGLGVDDELIDGYDDIDALDTVDDNDDQLMNEIVLGLDKAADADPDEGPSSYTNITNDQSDDDGEPADGGSKFSKTCQKYWMFLILTICHHKQAKITPINLK